MGRRKARKEAAQEQVFAHKRDENGEDEEGEGRKEAGFYACYLLTSLCPRFKGHTYIGFTVNPMRRIRQHNGEIGSGAWRTKKRRPWEMVLCIYGFPTNVSALQFEWAWQHPVESLAVRAAAASFKSLSGLANKIKLAYTMLSLPPWQSLNIRVNLFSTKYQIHTSCCPALPEQMRAQICSMDELPCYNLHGCGDELLDNDECEDNFDELSRECSSQEEARKLQDSPKKDCNSEENVHQQTNDNGVARVETSVSCATSHIQEETVRPGWDELPTESDMPLEKQSTNTPVAPKEQLFINSLDITSHEVEIIDIYPAIACREVEIIDIYPDIACREVEIIDILTPSPCYHVKLGSKRRRANEIIDLTNSPVFL